MTLEYSDILSNFTNRWLIDVSHKSSRYPKSMPTYSGELLIIDHLMSIDH
jgi:hypothetical protein